MPSCDVNFTFSWVKQGKTISPISPVITISSVSADLSATKHQLPEPVIPDRVGIFGMYLADGWRRLAVKNDAGTDTVESLDVSILQDRLLAPVLGIGDARSDERIDFVGGVRGVRELARLVDSGEYAVAFSLYPTSMESLLAVSDEGRIMPPKSTWFEPKIKSGLFVHPLDKTLR